MTRKTPAAKASENRRKARRRAERGHVGKQAYAAEATAEAAAAWMASHHPEFEFRAYECRICHAWHVGRTTNLRRSA